MATIKRRIHLVALLGLSSATLLTQGASAIPLERHAERPASQAGVGSSVSYMQKTFSMPVAGALLLNYFVDSQAGHDFLRVYVDGAAVFEQSGEDRIGRVQHDLSAGSHVVRIAYEKDATGDFGRDTAQVDDLVVKSRKGQEIFRFDVASTGVPAGWTGGGHAGGWKVTRPTLRRGLARPASAAFSGYTANGVVSSTQRAFTWPSGAQTNTLKVGYRVDSEANHDFFRIYIDGTEKFSTSGTRKAGTATIDVGGPGSHVVKFAYEKDQSVDEGMDDAEVLRLEALADGQAFQLLDLEAGELGSETASWTAGSPTQANWTLTPGSSALAYVLPGTAQPAIDGLRESAYSSGSRFAMGELSSAAVPPAKIRMLRSGSSLYLHAQVAADTPAAGNESGTLTLYLDRSSVDTRVGIGCSGAVGVPGPTARKVVTTYDIPEGARTADATTVQYVGTCSRSTPWALASASDKVPFELAAVEPKHDSLVGVELRVDPLDSEETVGIAATLLTESGSRYELPGLDAQPVEDADMTSWVTLFGLSLPNRNLPPGTWLVGAPRDTTAVD